MVGDEGNDNLIPTTVALETYSNCGCRTNGVGLGRMVFSLTACMYNTCKHTDTIKFPYYDTYIL